jgi:hypothetical protein
MICIEDYSKWDAMNAVELILSIKCFHHYFWNFGINF